VKNSKLKTILLVHRFYIILFLGLCMALFAFFIIKVYIIGQAQKQVRNELRIVQMACQNQLKSMALVIDQMDATDDLKSVQKYLSLDYLNRVSAKDAASISNDVVKKAVESKKTVGATRIMGSEEIKTLVGPQWESYSIAVKETPKARPVEQPLLKDAMTMEYARPLLDAKGNVTSVLYGGKILNKNEELIDGIVNMVFESAKLDSKAYGTVTLFQDDVRIATNVLDLQGQRAVGTKVSKEVYHRVVEQGGQWYDRAFVVKDWYLTAYEPIRDLNGRIIGILYVGILEKPFADMGRNIFLAFLIIIVLTSVLAGILSLVLAKKIHRSLAKVMTQTQEISEGQWGGKIGEETGIRELNELIDSFHVMADKLTQREASLAVSNKKLEDLNKDYLELVGFVSHELKGILSSIVLNAYLLVNKMLGEISPKQEATLRSMAKNLDYLSATVRNFLDLSRIEKGELKVNKKRVMLKADILKDALEAFADQAKEKGMTIADEIPKDVPVVIDPELMKIVVNNLLSNAVKYGRIGGRVVVRTAKASDGIQLEVYNDGKPIEPNDLDKLFKKFSRLLYRDRERVKGRGVGLYITREIVEKQGGRIWAESLETGNSFKFVIPEKE